MKFISGKDAIPEENSKDKEYLNALPNALSPSDDKIIFNLTEIKRKLNKIKTEFGMYGASLKVDILQLSEFVNAGIDPRNWDIRITFDPRALKILLSDKKIFRYVKDNKIDDVLTTLLSDVLIHEIGHWEVPRGTGDGCPYDLYIHYENFIDPITSALKEVGKIPSDYKGEHQTARYVANAIEDIINNFNCTRITKMNGQIFFWYLQGIVQDGKYSKFYEAFVKLNMYLFGDKKQYRLLRKYMTDDKEVNDCVKEFIRTLNLSENKEENLRWLMDRDNWPKIAYNFAKIMSRLLDENEGQGKSGEGAGHSPEEKYGRLSPSKAPGGEKGQHPPKKIVLDRFKAGRGIPDYFKTYEAFDLIYQQLADEIEIKAEEFTEGFNLPIIPYSHRPFDPEVDDIKKINPHKLILNDEGKVVFGVPRENFPIVFPMKKGIKSFPHFKLCIIDSSGSMSNGLNGSAGNKNIFPWGDNSKYHYAILGFYGILKYLVRQNMLHVVDVEVVNFSSRTIASDGSLEDAKKTLFSWQDGGTSINLSVLLNSLDRFPNEKNIVYTISDGEISNWDEIKNRFIETMKDQFYFHIQLGGTSQMAEDLKEAGLHVYFVNNGEELTKLMIDLTIEKYDQYAESHKMYNHTEK